MAFILARHDSIAPGGYFFLEVETWTRAACQPYEESWMSATFSLTRYTPQVITLILYFAGLRYKELYLLLFGVGLTVDGFINVIFNSLAVNDPRIDTCLPSWGSALTYQVQHSAFFVTFSLGYAALYRPRIKMWHMFVIQLFLTVNVLGAHFLNYHRSSSIIAGAALGTLTAFCYQSLLFWLIVPKFSVILRTRFVRYMAYQDSLCTGDCTPPHVLAVEAFDKQFPLSQRADYVERLKAREFVAAQTF
jgi:hypothetical protein